MELVNPAWRTDLLFTRFDGLVEERGDHVVVRSPANPFYYWGNFVLLPAPPRDARALEDALRLFGEAFADEPDVRHVALGWDGLDADWGAAEELLATGEPWEREDGVVLALERSGPAVALPAPWEIRALADDAEWAASDALNGIASPGPSGTPRHDEFLRRLRRRYRAMVEAGLGTWLGAFRAGELVAHLGLFRDAELARFQSVETHPDHRRQGACTALVAEGCRVALEDWGVERVIIVAEGGSPADRVYRRCGLAPLGRQCGLQRAPSADRASEPDTGA